MTSTAIQLEKIKSVDKLLPPRGANIYDAGIRDNQKGHVKYGPKSSDQPTLLLPDLLFDDDGNKIMPGYYELLLSEDRQNLLLSQSQRILAVIPVFKIEDDRTQAQISQPKDRKSQKKADKEQKKKEKKTKKLIEQGKITEEPGIYNNATIQYEEDGDYYLIKYERGQIRAWGAIKL